MKLPKKIASLLTVTLVAGSGLGNVSQVSAAQGVSSEILAGAGRWETAVEISKKGWTSATEAVIVNDSAISDALTATPFAESKNAPILLTQKDKLDERTKSELKRLNVKKVYLIGGTNVLNESVEATLKAQNITVERIYGNTRYETSLEIAKKLNEIKPVSEIAVVDGYKGLADAVSVAPVAADKDMPIILSHPTKGTEATDSFIKEKNIKTSYVIGGSAAISNETANKLPNAKRIEGSNRNETNAKVIETFYTEKELKNAYVAKDGIAKENELIDGLAVGVLAAKNDSPVILVRNSLHKSQKDVTNTKNIKTITQVGGGSNKSSVNELKSMQEVTVHNVSTVEQLNKAIEKADANDTINMNPTTRASINEEITINTNKNIEINLSGDYKNTITITSPNAKIVNKGTITKVVIKNSKGATLENAKGAKITNIEVQSSASNVSLVNSGTVTYIKNDASGTKINNAGTITNRPTGSQTPSVDGNRPGGSTDGGGSSSGGGSVTPKPDPTKKDVSSLPELENALSNDKIKTINITKSISDISERIDIKRAVTINGLNGAELSFTNDITNIEKGKNGILVEADGVKINNLKVSMTEKQDWQGTYGIQVYNAKDVTLENVSSSGADGGILVNGSNVTLSGTIDVSGNEFGGIEVSKGSALTEGSILTVGTSTLVNTTETYGQPTIWVVKDQGEVEGGSFTESNDVKEGQTQYYLNSENLETINVSNLKELQDALSNDKIKTININNDIELEQRIDINRPVTINGLNGAELSFTNDITNIEKGKNGILVEADGVKINNLKVSLIKEDGWKGTYGIQVYNAKDVTLENVTSSGADGGILVNGSNVTLSGTIDVSGNEFGGIEVSNGAPTLTVNGEVIYEGESETKPVIWIDGYGCDGTNGLNESIVTFGDGIKKLNGREVCDHNVNPNKHQYYFTVNTY